jgi:hypothetical protein
MSETGGRVTPIFGVADKGHAALIGSAALIVAGETCLGTAKHVLDENATSTLYIDGLSKLEILKGDFLVSGYPETKNRNWANRRPVGLLRETE